jgi:hypothetical protein
MCSLLVVIIGLFPLSSTSYFPSTNTSLQFSHTLAVNPANSSFLFPCESIAGGDTNEGDVVLAIEIGGDCVNGGTKGFP